MSDSSPFDLHSTVPTNPPPTEHRGEVMLVDEEICVRIFIERVLIGFGYGVFSHSSAESALEALPNHRPRLILTDCRLGGMSGLQFIEEVRQLYPDVPIVGMSGEHVNGEAMLEAGAAMFLEKPLSIECLTKTIPIMSTRVGMPDGD